MQIDHDKLVKKQLVWYCYGDNARVGPFRVKDFRGDYQGRHVLLHGVHGTAGDDRDVLLADDEDFGPLLFYDTST